MWKQMMSLLAQGRSNNRSRRDGDCEQVGTRRTGTRWTIASAMCSGVLLISPNAFSNLSDGNDRKAGTSPRSPDCGSSCYPITPHVRSHPNATPQQTAAVIAIISSMNLQDDTIFANGFENQL